MNVQSAAAGQIGELLTGEGLLSRDQLAHSIEIQKEQFPSQPLGRVCVTLGFVSEADLASVLVKQRQRLQLGELWVHLGVIPVEQLNDVLKYQKKFHPKKKLGALLIDKGLIDDATAGEMLKVALAQQMTTLLQGGVLKVLQGWTDYAQVRAVATC